VRRQQQQQQQEPGATLFVGDLPEMGFGSSDLQGLFEGLGFNVVRARVMGAQCYGFVEFGSADEAEQALEATQGDQSDWQLPRRIRADWAKGSMPSWQRGKALLRPYEQGGVDLAGLEAYENPVARFYRLSQQAVMTTAMQHALMQQQAMAVWGQGPAGGAGEEGEHDVEQEEGEAEVPPPAAVAAAAAAAAAAVPVMGVLPAAAMGGMAGRQIITYDDI
jgi:hypothetical protein